MIAIKTIREQPLFFLLQRSAIVVIHLCDQSHICMHAS
jgi:hypothetical protein